MAVASPIYPSLQGSYANIQNALSQGADIAGKTPGVAGAAAAIVKPLGEEVQQRRQQLFETTLQDHLNQNKAIYAAQAEGRTQTTPDMAASFAENMGLDPDATKNIMPSGVWQTPGERMNLATQLKRQDTIEQMASDKEKKGDQVGANLMRLFARSQGPESDQMIARLNGIAQVDRVINPVTHLPEYVDHYTKMPLGGAYAATSSPTPGGANDLPSLDKLDIRQGDALRTAAKSSAGDPALKPMAVSMDELKATRNLIDKNIPGTQINIGADAARAIGGVPGGRFTALMAVSEGKDPSLMGKLGQGYQTITAGNLSKNNQDLLRREVDTAMDQKRSELATALQEKHSQLKSQAPYASDDLIANQLGYQRYLKSQNKQEFNSLTDLQDAVKSGKIDKSTAIEMAKTRGWVQ